MTPRLPAVVRQSLAALGGYFWLPCTVCGENFAGFEWRDYDGLPSSVPDPDLGLNFSWGICPDCTVAGYGYPYGWAVEHLSKATP